MFSHLHSIHMQGKAMEGQIPGNWIELFKPQLKEDNVHYIRYFQVRHARLIIVLLIMPI